MKVLKFKDASIRLRSDDTHVTTSYLNRRYPLVKCADPQYDVKFRLKLILVESSENHVMMHHKLMK